MRVHPHPRQDVFAGRQILVERLVHVPEEGETDHVENGQARGMRIARSVRHSGNPPAVPDALLVFTFILIIPFIIELAEQMIAKGVPWPMLLRLMVTLLPAGAGADHPDGAADRHARRASAGSPPIASWW